MPSPALPLVGGDQHVAPVVGLELRREGDLGVGDALQVHRLGGVGHVEDVVPLARRAVEQDLVDVRAVVEERVVERGRPRGGRLRQRLGGQRIGHVEEAHVLAGVVVGAQHPAVGRHRVRALRGRDGGQQLRARLVAHVEDRRPLAVPARAEGVVGGEVEEAGVDAQGDVVPAAAALDRAHPPRLAGIGDVDDHEASEEADVRVVARELEIGGSPFGDVVVGDDLHRERAPSTAVAVHRYTRASGTLRAGYARRVRMRIATARGYRGSARRARSGVDRRSGTGRCRSALEHRPCC